MSMTGFPGLQIQIPFVGYQMDNFHLKTWPPHTDFPVVIDLHGNTISCYGDTRWDLSPWANYTLTIHFGDGPGQGKKISAQNAQYLRQVVAWWIWGESAAPTVRSLVYRFESIKPLFVACSDAGILVTELCEHPDIIAFVAKYYKQRASRLISYLHSLLVAKDVLGFIILDEKGIAILSELMPDYITTQTAYIPARIWSYQIF